MAAAFTLALATLPLCALGALTVSKLRRRYKWLLLGAYLMIYLPFSLLGRYETANHGGMDWRDWWCPRGMAEPYQRVMGVGRGRVLRGRAKVRLTYFGALFWPLIALDNLLWHRTRESDLSKSI